MTKTPKIKAPAVKRPTTAMLDRFIELREVKKQHEAKARLIEKEMDTIKAALTEYTEANGNDVQTCGYRLRMVEGGRYPSWRNVVEEKLGADVVAEVIASTPPKVNLEVMPAE